MLVESGLVLALDQDKAPKLYGGKLFAAQRCSTTSQSAQSDVARLCCVCRPSRASV